MSEEINIVLKGYRPISLDETGRVRLMNRVDTKYVTTEASLLQFLRLAKPDFRVMEIDSSRNMPYSTCYYDTSDRNMYYEHERGRAARQKIRVREYENTGAKFLEIKRKNNKGRTDKKRVRLSGEETAGVANLYDSTQTFPGALDAWSEFIDRKSRYTASDLVPQIETHFRRITLVDEAMTERLTIDTCLEFTNLSTGRSACLDGLAIIEAKRDGGARSRTAGLLRCLHIHPAGFSKYCIGMALTDPSLRRNNLKPKLRMVSRMLTGSPDLQKIQCVNPINCSPQEGTDMSDF
ncbi:MAG: polyphosphate polymerase domain-containing protein [Bacteroidales bacterium]|nr:polyphosphate polymerase domain-containing protein [Bacteroidales bacterium]